MRRRRLLRPTVSVALFPFLAVLICTMGALIVLLVLVVQQARAEASVAAESGSGEEEEVIASLRQQQSNHEWRREILQKQRGELAEKLADSRLQLAHLEDHIRRLEEKWAALQATAAELVDLQTESNQTRETASQQREQLQRQLAAARAELERVRGEAESRPRSFAIIPYLGPNGTQRRPIFIECTANGIILQPEGVVLTARDFDGPLGPGNPLDAALRATREHLARIGADELYGEPYPLLVVRPDGAIAYNVARLAMKAWDDEFGYELIDQEMKLAYPAVDPHLKQLLEATIQDARQRQLALAAAMPSQFGGDGLGDFSASSLRAGLAGAAHTGLGGTFAGAGASNGSDGVEGRFREAGSVRSPSASANRRAAANRSAEPVAAAGTPGGLDAPAAPGSAGASVSLSRTRGKDWAVPQAPAGATAITRPIRIVCQSDRLVILPERADPRAPRVLEMPNGPSAIVDRFVDAIWEHVGRWGIAVAGGYWEPKLRVTVAPGGESSFQRLAQLLDGSGLEVQRIVDR